MYNQLTQVVFLFVVMLPNEQLTPELSQQIKGAIKNGLSPRHVPRYLIAVPEIPTTISGKKVESAIKQTISGYDVKPSNTVSNPASIDFFKRFRELEHEPRASRL